MKEKVLVIGWDGATWDVISPLLKRGKMPHLKKLIDKGESTSLKSTLPSISSVAWTTFATGKNPGKHGIFSFLRKQGQKFIPLTSQDVESKRMWDITSENNFFSVVINVPMTYPPSRLKGKLICGYLSPGDTTYTYPSSLGEKIKQKGYQIEALSEGFEEEKPQKFLKELNYTIEKRTEVALGLMESEPWNLFVIVYTGLDRLQHYFWKYMGKENSKYEKAIARHYQKLDQQLGKFLEKVSPETKVIVLSDHGFGPLKGEVYVNHWMEREGYLKLKKGTLEKLGITQQRLVSSLRRVRIFPFLKKFLKNIGLYQFSKSIPKPSLDRIDFNHTQAFAGNFGGHIYVTGEEKMRDEVKNNLKNLRNPRTGEKFFKVHSKEEIYQGKMLDEAPSLIIDSKKWDPVGYLGYGKLYSPHIKKSGKHRREGILATNFKIKRKNNSLQDIAPTILELLQVKIPKDMDGKSLLRENFSH